MDQRVRSIMTSVPVAVGALTAVTEVAHRMKAEDIGAVLVTDGAELRGVVTDRDLVVRVMAEGRDPGETTVMAACSADLVTVGPDEPAAHAVQLMRKHALRRLPVVEGGEVVGIVALGDLAVGRDPESALGAISAAAPNR